MMGAGTYFFYSNTAKARQEKVVKRVRVEIPLEEKKELPQVPPEKAEPSQDAKKTVKEPPHTIVKSKEKNLRTPNEEIKKTEKSLSVNKSDEVKKIEKKEEKPEIRLHEKILTAKNEDKPDTKIPQKIKETKKQVSTEQKIQQKKELKKITGGSWTLHIASYTTMDDDVKSIVRKLKEDGYNAYIIQFNPKGKIWYRLRVGFFQSEETAKAEGKKIARAYNIKGIWTTKPTKNEILLNNN